MVEHNSVLSVTSVAENLFIQPMAIQHNFATLMMS
jgi:hypothetical protein